jgi:hypothetical protein
MNDEFVAKRGPTRGVKERIKTVFVSINLLGF